MKTHKCFSRLSPIPGLVLAFLNTTYAEGKDNSCGACPKLLYSYHSLELVSAEGRVRWQCMEGQSREARILGDWSVLAGRRKRQLWGQTDALLTLCFLVGDLGAGGGSIVPKAEEECLILSLIAAKPQPSLLVPSIHNSTPCDGSWTPAASSFAFPKVLPEVTLVWLLLDESGKRAEAAFPTGA